MRLARGSIGESYRAQNDRLRSAAHELAGIREKDAMVVSLENLIEHFGSGMSGSCHRAARDWATRLRGPSARSPVVSAEAAGAVALLRRALEDAQLWSLDADGWELIEPGLRRTYRRGRHALGLAKATPDAEALHEWRKRVKDMWYSLRLLQGAWPPVLRALADEAHALSEDLGDHHDLDELAKAIEAGEMGPLRTAEAELLGHAGMRQEELYREAVLKGRRLYAEPPKRYAARLGVLWHAWESVAS